MGDTRCLILPDDRSHFAEWAVEHDVGSQLSRFQRGRCISSVPASSIRRLVGPSAHLSTMLIQFQR